MKLGRVGGMECSALLLAALGALGAEAQNGIHARGQVCMTSVIA